MQIIKSITARELFKKFPEIKKALWGSEFWSDGEYIGTVGDGILSDIILNYVETQGTTEEKEGFKQMILLEFGTNLWEAPPQFDSTGYGIGQTHHSTA